MFEFNYNAKEGIRIGQYFHDIMWEEGVFCGVRRAFTGKKGGNSFPRKKIGKFMAGRKIGMLKKWWEHTFRSESEKKRKKTAKKSPRNSEFCGIPAEFPT